MTTIHDPRPPAGDDRRARRARQQLRLPRERWLAIAMACVLMLAAAHRVTAHEPREPASGAGAAPEPTRVATFGEARLRLPRSWVTLDRAAGHVTWGAVDRRHTVTLASTPQGSASLPAAVDAAIAASAEALPGAVLDGRPVPIDLAHAPRRDAAMLVRWTLAAGGGAGELLVAQSWRRDSRAALDLVATWTSADGRWSIDPRDGIPFSSASR